MTIAATCPECDAVFRVGDEHAGRRFRCKQCSAICQVPDHGKSEPKEAPPRKKRRTTRPPAKKRPQRPTAPVDEWEQDDCGYDEYSYDYDEYEDYERDENLPVRSRRVAGTKRRSRSGRNRSSSWASESTIRILKGVGIGVACLVLYVAVIIGAFSLGRFSPSSARPIAIVLFLVGAPSLVVSHLALLLAAFREDFIVGMLYLFVPVYPLYWVVTRWESARGWVVTLFVGFYAVTGASMMKAGLFKAMS